MKNNNATFFFLFFITLNSAIYSMNNENGSKNRGGATKKSDISTHIPAKPKQERTSNNYPLSELVQEYASLLNEYELKEVTEIIAPFLEKSKIHTMPDKRSHYTVPAAVFSLELHYNKDGKGTFFSEISCSSAIPSNAILLNDTHLKIGVSYDNGQVKPHITAFNNAPNLIQKEATNLLFQQINIAMDDSRLAETQKKCEIITKQIHEKKKDKCNDWKQTLEQLKPFLSEEKRKALENRIKALEEEIRGSR